MQDSLDSDAITIRINELDREYLGIKYSSVNMSDIYQSRSYPGSLVFPLYLNSFR